jgi:hypothetical protein
MKETGATEQKQLELALGDHVEPPPMRPGRRSVSRANWWFQQMYAAVEKALDWQPSPPPRPEQTHLAIGRSPWN